MTSTASVDSIQLVGRTAKTRNLNDRAGSIDRLRKQELSYAWGARITLERRIAFYGSVFYRLYFEDRR